MVLSSSPGVSIKVVDSSAYTTGTQTTIPLIVMATRANKTVDGLVAAGTTEANKLRLITSQRELVKNYGAPVFVKSNDTPLYGDELNELGLLAAYQALGLSSLAYVIRADINLDELEPTPNEPTLPPTDGTYWIPKNNVVGGIFKYDGSNWSAVPFTVYTTAPTGADGTDGDWCFDYSDLNGTIKYKFGGIWKAASNSNLSSDFGASTTMHVQSTTPTSPTSGDYWFKTTKSGGGVDLSLGRYSATQGTFQIQAIIRDSTPPTPNEGTIWEDTSQIATSGARPLYVGTGAAFIPLPVFVQSDAPHTPPNAGRKWYDDNHADFALYVEGTDVGRGNEWVPIDTVTVSNPSRTQKVISASAPLAPQEGAIWVDISTPTKLDIFPVVKKYVSGSWIDISDSIVIQDTDPDATAVVNGTYWLNTGESRTRYIVKEYVPDYKAVTVQLNTTTNKYEVVEEVGTKWRPVNAEFGRKSVRKTIVTALQAAFNENHEIRAEDTVYHLIACPGYPELYDEMNTLNVDIGELAFILVDPPKYANIGVITGSKGRSISVTEWITNSRAATTNGEDGLSAGSPYAATFYPWGIMSNVDGTDVYAPPSIQAMRTIIYNDTVAYPWTAPAGLSRGRTDVFTSVGYLDENDEYVPIKLTPGQSDALYNVNINPILYKNRTLAIYGQKTLYGSTTALDRINVARLLATIKRNIKRSLETYLFEINEAGTRRSVKNTVDRYLSSIAAKNGIYDWLTICDASNNPGDVIDQNKLNVDILIKPSKVIEFIAATITVVNTSDSLQ